LKLWSISTTLKNPYRFRDFLKVLSELEGKEWNKNTQIEFQIKLIQHRLYGLTNQFLKDLPKDLEEKFLDFDKKLDYKTAKKIFETKNYTDPAMRGRTSFKPLEKFGTVAIIDDRIKLTNLGKWVLSDKFDINKFFLKTLLKWQYSNPLDRDFKNFNIKPFIGVLELIYKVNKKCKEMNLKAKGISFWEFEIFTLSLTNYKEIDKKVEELLKFRENLESIKGFKEKERFYKKFKENYLSNFSNKKHSRDYADNAIRYFRLTNLLYIRGGGFYIDLDERKLDLIKFVINEIGSYKENFENKLAYIEYLSNLDLPKIDFEEKNFFIENILNLDSKFSFEKLKELNLEELKNIYQNLLIINKKRILNIDDVISNLKNFREHPTLKPSVALEKYVTEALIIINDALKIKPNYIAGDDGEIIFTAPANTPDIECFYESFNSICEVTNLTSKEQWFNEGQPVMRHLRNFENKYSNAYALFIAPKLHQDTINTFWIAVKYEYEGKKQKIIPLTISQLIEILEVVKKCKNLNHKKIKEFLDDVSNVNHISSSKEWIGNIPNKIKKFKENLCS
jgi:hypothetical protein